ncbi:aminotransferase class I/II-fold pyridoxal phosphate-dependent enzyme [Shewanella surugensis]|uniref:8-amino-7-oxononanoate synthase n=1 Tax=Shewanella surugensis TaxID=212020 RepID=A0ABT0L7F8_9GAMM|nr:8-amino-7-oxononanoate synthase [Shewanella surugensis]MCL1123629.1 8-amino-7-oxononanoate synthase [Shewanella surugensis]
MSDNALTHKIIAQQTKLQQADLLRKRQPVHLTDGANLASKQQHFVNFASNDYLGLSRDPAIAAALHRGALKYGAGSTASPLVTGYSPAHTQLEQRLCELTGQEAAILFCSGFSANSALMKTLFNASDKVIADKLIHASIIDGLRDSGAQFKRFHHNNIESVKTHLAQFSPCAVLTESVFSMDGTQAPLAELSALCQQYGAWLIVDDAHGFGLLGHRGLGATQVQSPEMTSASLQHFGLLGQQGLGSTQVKLDSALPIDAQVITFGKAMGCQGAAILGSQALVDFLVANARHYIYSTALSPANAMAALASLECIVLADNKRQRLHNNITLFRRLCEQEGIVLTNSITAIQPIIIGEQQRMLQVADILKNKGFWVGAIRPPTVPKGSARLRITLNASHQSADIQALVDSLSLALQAH